MICLNSTVAGPFRRHILPWTWPFSKCSSSSQLPKKGTQIAFSRVFNMFNTTHTGDPWPAVFGEGISCTAFRPNHCNSSWFSSILGTRQRTQQFAGRSAIQPPPSTVPPTPNPECSGSHNFEIAKHTCLSPGFELLCFLECTNVPQCAANKPLLYLPAWNGVSDVVLWRRSYLYTQLEPKEAPSTGVDGH